MQTTDIEFSTTGKLVSTTDVNRARFLKKTVSIKALVGNVPAHYELNGNTVSIYTRSEMYEIEV